MFRVRRSYDRRELEIVKVGPCNIYLDPRLMDRYGERNRSEWNPRNLEMVQYFNHYIDLGRQTWNLNVRYAQGRHQLRRLLGEHGRLFVKSVVKGHASLVTDYEAYMRGFSDLDIVDDDSLSLLVSEVIAIREIEAVVRRRRVSRTDEWRHYIYRGKRVATSHAFDCDEGRTSCEHRELNERYADRVAERLCGTDFAASYVLDTCTLEDGGCTVVEANFFFSAGIYADDALEAIAAAIIQGQPG